MPELLDPTEDAKALHASKNSTRQKTEYVDGLDGRVQLRRTAGGYLQVWPRPTPEALEQLYSQDFYDNHNPEFLAQKRREQTYWDATWSMRRKLMEAALSPSRRTLLDVGCSGGFLLDHFQRHRWQGVGIEPSTSASLWAKNEFGLLVFNGTLIDYPDEATSEIESTNQSSFPTSFDAIHSSQVLEHVLDPEFFIERIASLLVPEGVVYIEVPNEFSVLQETARERLSKPAWWVAPETHLNYFDFDTLSALLKRHGLVEIDRLASFPIEMFLLMGDDYVGHPEVGSRCHERRMNFERSLIETGRGSELLRLYRAIGEAGMGRTCGILARKI